MYLSRKLRRIVFSTFITLCSLFLWVSISLSYQSPNIFASIQNPDLPSVRDVDIRNFAFSPQNIEISIGEIIRWTNRDGAPHTATSSGSPPTSFDSGTLSQGQTAEFQFDQAGTYDYICTIHPSMQAQVVVSDMSDTMYTIFLPSITK